MTGRLVEENRRVPGEEVVQVPSSVPPSTARSMMAGNLDRFLKSTTPIVPALRLSEVNVW